MKEEQPTLFELPNYNSLFDYTADYYKAATYLDSLLENGIKPGLERISVLCKKLGDPQLAYPVIQVTGTNGKTSVTKMIGAILSAHGLKTGVYTSPHLFSYKERFVIDEEMIRDEELLKLVNKLKKKIKETDELTRDPMTNFEAVTAAAFKYFEENKVDVAVMEVGMGGRFDATSVGDASIGVITNVELDHTDVLGDTIEKIANEKASIVKKGAKAVLGKMKIDALEIIKAEAKEKGATVFEEGVDFSILSADSLANGRYKTDIKGVLSTYKSVNAPVSGKHQLSNLSVAMAASELFLNAPLKKIALKDALKGIELTGRQQLLRRTPKILADVSHNPAGARKLASSISKDYDFERLITVLAIFKDKDYAGIIEALEPHSDLMIFTKNSSDRSATPQELKSVSRSEKIVIEPDIKKALDRAINEAGAADMICVTGSFYTVADASVYLYSKFANK